MPQLVSPDSRFRVSFLDAVRESVAEDEYFGDTLKRELAVYGDTWHEPDGFVRYVAAIREEEHATAMLREVLPYARAVGLDRVLVTCDTTNVGSRKVIEANGGEFEDERGGKLRFWIRTGC
ncbi:GNAT family N-acetyltransferase [Streptomyces sp. NPDC048825]|uniref:GNAT family N-acetyltransferase n=1 Tax=Streptomyces sp. NPDC048825 TaxID=3365592 RepID=UPI0037234B12